MAEGSGLATVLRTRPTIRSRAAARFVNGLRSRFITPPPAFCSRSPVVWRLQLVQHDARRRPGGGSQFMSQSKSTQTAHELHDESCSTEVAGMRRVAVSVADTVATHARHSGASWPPLGRRSGDVGQL